MANTNPPMTSKDASVMINLLKDISKKLDGNSSSGTGTGTRATITNPTKDFQNYLKKMKKPQFLNNPVVHKLLKSEFGRMFLKVGYYFKENTRDLFQKLKASFSTLFREIFGQLYDQIAPFVNAIKALGQYIFNIVLRPIGKGVKWGLGKIFGGTGDKKLLDENKKHTSLLKRIWIALKGRAGTYYGGVKGKVMDAGAGVFGSLKGMFGKLFSGFKFGIRETGKKGISGLFSDLWDSIPTIAKLALGGLAVAGIGKTIWDSLPQETKDTLNKAFTDAGTWLLKKAGGALMDGIMAVSKMGAEAIFGKENIAASQKAAGDLWSDTHKTIIDEKGFEHIEEAGLLDTVKATFKWIGRSNAIKGAIAGGIAGSIIPIVGPFIGAAAGGIIGTVLPSTPNTSSVVPQGDVVRKGDRVRTAGANPELLNRITSLQSAVGNLGITDLMRTPDESRAMIADRKIHPERYKYPIADPDKGQTSRHWSGLAVDMTRNIPEAVLNQYGLYRPMPVKDPIHVEMMGSRGGAGGANIDSIISEAAAKYGVPDGLIRALISHESGFNRMAFNDKNANGSIDRGLMQLNSRNESIWKRYGLTDYFDAKQNVDAGTHFFSDIMKQKNVNGDIDKALACYNTGKPDTMRAAKYIASVKSKWGATGKMYAKGAGTGGVGTIDSGTGGFGSLLGGLGGGLAEVADLAGFIGTFTAKLTEAMMNAPLTVNEAKTPATANPAGDAVRAIRGAESHLSMVSNVGDAGGSFSPSPGNSMSISNVGGGSSGGGGTSQEQVPEPSSSIMGSTPLMWLVYNNSI